MKRQYTKNRIVVLITGSDGQLGKTLTEECLKAGLIPVPFSSEKLDITKACDVDRIVGDVKPDVIVNCAAYTAVDAAEDPENQSKAFAVNSKGVEHLVRAANKYSAKLIHISTDYVFDGKKGRPYVETDQPKPLSVYGISKRVGELNAMDADIYAILRTAGLYSEYGKNFVKTMLSKFRKGKDVEVVFDQLGSPTYTRDLAKAIAHIIPQLGRKTNGIYHFANKKATSWYSLAMAVRDYFDFRIHIKAIRLEEYPLPAKRPKHSHLDTSKIEEVFGIEIREWWDAFPDCMRHIIAYEKKKRQAA